MKKFLFASTVGIFLTLPLIAQPAAPVDSDSDSEVTEAIDYNLWVCEARPTSQFFFSRGPEYHGYSRLFAAGSGEGQRARATARDRAQRICEWSTGMRCFTNANGCRVERYQARGGFRP